MNFNNFFPNCLSFAAPKVTCRRSKKSKVSNSSPVACTGVSDTYSAWINVAVVILTSAYYSMQRPNVFIFKFYLISKKLISEYAITNLVIFGISYIFNPFKSVLVKSQICRAAWFLLMSWLNWDELANKTSSFRRFSIFKVLILDPLTTKINKSTTELVLKYSTFEFKKLRC